MLSCTLQVLQIQQTICQVSRLSLTWAVTPTKILGSVYACILLPLMSKLEQAQSLFTTTTRTTYYHALPPLTNAFKACPSGRGIELWLHDSMLIFKISVSTKG